MQALEAVVQSPAALAAAADGPDAQVWGVKPGGGGANVMSMVYPHARETGPGVFIMPSSNPMPLMSHMDPHMPLPSGRPAPVPLGGS